MKEHERQANVERRAADSSGTRDRDRDRRDERDRDRDKDREKDHDKVISEVNIGSARASDDC